MQQKQCQCECEKTKSVSIGMKMVGENHEKKGEQALKALQPLYLYGLEILWWQEKAIK